MAVDSNEVLERIEEGEEEEREECRELSFLGSVRSEEEQSKYTSCFEGSLEEMLEAARGSRL